MTSSRTKRVAVLAAALVISSTTLAACASTTSPSHVGLYYNVGPIEGNRFSHCTIPSMTDDYPINDEIKYVPIDGRTWLIDEGAGADSNNLTMVTAKPEPGQTTGITVKISSQTSFMLNSFCGEDNKDPESPLVRWWDKYGRGYGADVDPGQSAEEQRQDPGWKSMLVNVLVPALNTAIKDTAKSYPAAALISGAANSPIVIDGVQREGLRVEIGQRMAVELRRLTGGDFFCGPTFSRSSASCPPVEVTTQAEYASADLVAAQAEKQAAVERAAAAVAEAEGKLRAAEIEGQLYDNPARLELELAKIELAKVEKCVQSPNCTLILDGGAGGGTIVNGSRQ